MCMLIKKDLGHVDMLFISVPVCPNFCIKGEGGESCDANKPAACDVRHEFCF